MPRRDALGRLLPDDADLAARQEAEATGIEALLRPLNPPVVLARRTVAGGGGGPPPRGPRANAPRPRGRRYPSRSTRSNGCLCG